MSGFDPADAWALAESLRPGTALAFLLIEHGWAQPLFDAIAETGGVLVGEGFLTAEAGLVVGAEVAAMEEAAGVIAAAQAAEVSATLEAMAAEARASEAVAASEAIRAAAAAAAIRALIDAGVVAEEAAHEAVEAVAAAGLVVAAAEDAVGELLAEDEVEVKAAQEAAAEAVAEAAATVKAASITVAEGAGPAVLAHEVVVRGHRRQTGDLPIRSEGSSRAHLQEARCSRPGRGRQPGPGPRDHEVTTDFVEQSRVGRPPAKPSPLSRSPDHAL